MPHIEEDGFDGFGDGAKTGAGATTETRQMPPKRSLSMLTLKEAGQGAGVGGGAF